MKSKTILFFILFISCACSNLHEPKKGLTQQKAFKNIDISPVRVGSYSTEYKRDNNKIIFHFRNGSRVVNRQEFIDLLADKTHGDFRSLINKSIAHLPSDALGYQLKAPLIDKNTKHEAFYLVATVAPDLAYEASNKSFYPYLKHCKPKMSDDVDNTPYEGHFISMVGTNLEHVRLYEHKQLDNGTVAFKGIDAAHPSSKKIMIAPCPLSSDPKAHINNALGHIYAYAQKIGEKGQEQRLQSFWYTVGLMAKKMFNGGTLKDADGQEVSNFKGLFLNTHGLSVGYLHFRVELEPSYYDGVEFLTSQKTAADYYKKVFGIDSKPPTAPKTSGINTFLRSKFVNNTDRTFLAPVTVNQELSDIYNGNYPKASVLADYNSGRIADFWLAANLGPDFEAQLPQKIQQKLSERNLLGKNKVDIHWVVQLRDFIGHNSDNGTPNITLLKAHTWADPDVPQQFVGNRLYADFDYGVFESDFDVSYQVKVDQMLPFNVHTHDGMLSPYTALIKLPANTMQSVSFYSLVIGKPYQSQEERAIVTLHWILGGDMNMSNKNGDFFDFGKILFAPSRRNPEYFIWRHVNQKYACVKEFLDELRKTSFGDSLLMRKLDLLLN